MQGRKLSALPTLRSLHRLIAKGIVTSAGRLTGAELRYLRSEMGLTQAQLAKLVHRQPLTVSRWERGQNLLEGAMDAFIRILASRKLNLDEIDPEEVSGWCISITRKKEPIRLDATDPQNYRLVA